jgi:hypothetical protein
MWKRCGKCKIVYGANDPREKCHICGDDLQPYNKPVSLKTAYRYARLVNDAGFERTERVEEISVLERGVRIRAEQVLRTPDGDIVERSQ